MFQKGRVKTGGRKKGVQNKPISLLKDAILAAAELAGGEDTDDRKGGMIGYLQRQAKENPGPFLSLLGKVLPTQVASDPENPLEIIVRIGGEHG